ncbi:MAG: helix-turn-helix transcriptional regulator [Ruminococcaceae bacterium]|jgi:transcriptional regulator with XRE-family HTH domain|nr:helix-turn-helix transcriptional regulator [Oscillospiraceae bacterium]
MDIIKVFGNNLKKYRTQLGLSQEAFADKCGLHRTYISAIECYRRSIALENVQRIADALGIETYLLFIEGDNDDHNT